MVGKRRFGPEVAAAVEEEGVSVLFIQSDPAVAELYRLKLELDGYRVRVITSGVEVPRSATEPPPDLIYLDVLRPSTEQATLLRSLHARRATRDIPVVILSGCAVDGLEAAGFAFAPHDYVVRREGDASSLAGAIESLSLGFTAHMR